MSDNHHHAPTTTPKTNGTVDTIMSIFNIFDAPVTFFRSI